MPRRPAPAPPFVTAASTPPKTLARLRLALAEAPERPSLAAAKEVLLLTGAEVLPADAYRQIQRWEEMA